MGIFALLKDSKIVVKAKKLKKSNNEVVTKQVLYYANKILLHAKYRTHNKSESVGLTEIITLYLDNNTKKYGTQQVAHIYETDKKSKQNDIYRIAFILDAKKDSGYIMISTSLYVLVTAPVEKDSVVKGQSLLQFMQEQVDIPIV